MATRQAAEGNALRKASQQAALAQGWTGGEGEGAINGNRLKILECIFKN